MAPIVPNYDSPQVRKQGLPNVLINPSAPAEAFGGGPSLARIGGLQSDILKDEQEIFVRENKERQDQEQQAQHDANRMKAYEQIRAFNDWEQSNVFDPDKGAASMRGRNALGVPKILSDSFDKFVEEQKKGLTNDDQRLAFEGIVTERRDSLQRWTRTHVAKQTEIADEAEYEASIDSAKKRVMANPSSAAVEIPFIQGLTAERMRKAGLDKSVIETAQANQASEMHGLVINSLLAGRQTGEAKKYFDAHADSISPDIKARVLANLQESDRRGKAYEIIDRVFSDTRVREYTGAGNNWTMKGEEPAKSWDEARERIKRDAGDDAELRSLAEQMGRQRWSEVGHAREAAAEQLYDASLKSVLANPAKHPTEVIDPATWNSLSGANQKSLLSVYKAPEKNDDASWLVFESLSDAEIRKIPLSEYHSKFWSKLNQHYRDKADTIRRQALEAGQNPKEAEKFKSRMSDDELMLRSFVGAGLAGESIGVGGVLQKADTIEKISKNSESASRWMAFKERVDALSEGFHAKTGKNPDDKQLKLFITQAANQFRREVTLDRVWMKGDLKRRVVELTDAEVAEYPFVEVQNDEPVMRAFYEVAKQSKAAPAGLTPRDYYDRNLARVNKAYLLQFREPDLTEEQLKLRWKKILAGEE